MTAAGGHAAGGHGLAPWATEADASTLARGLNLAIRGGALPLLLGLRLAGLAGRPEGDALPVARGSFALASKVALDELFFCTEVASAPVVALQDRQRLAREARRAVRRWEREGWLADPAAYHEDPPPLTAARIHDRLSPWGRFRRLRFESGFAPRTGEPGRQRWLSYRRNRVAHAWLLEHRGRPRPWVVCVPGYRMGRPLVDFAGFRVHWLHRKLGLNVAVPVMPLHGPRSVGRRGGDGFLRGDFLDTVHAQAQAVWDVRRLARWLRAEGAPAVGVHGVSLGGYTAALLASLERNLDCVIAGIPAACFVRLIRTHAPRPAVRMLELFGVDFETLELLLRPVAPLAIAPRVPRARLFLYAGTADRLATADHARDLWLHWRRPRIAWYEGSHVSFLFEAKVEQLIEHALATSGLGRSRIPG